MDKTLAILIRRAWIPRTLIKPEMTEEVVLTCSSIVSEGRLKQGTPEDAG